MFVSYQECNLSNCMCPVIVADNRKDVAKVFNVISCEEKSVSI